MTLTQGDELVCACCLLPSDGARLAALSDRLREFDDAELGDFVAGADGERVVRNTMQTANTLGKLPSVRILYAVAISPAVTLMPPRPVVEYIPRNPPREDVAPWISRRPTGLPKWATGTISGTFLPDNDTTTENKG